MTTNFQEWLDAVEPEGHEEVYALYRAVKDCSLFGIYDVKPARGGSDRWIVSASNSEYSLLLASSDAKEAFIRHLTKTYSDRDLDIESWCSLKHALSKDD